MNTRRRSLRPGAVIAAALAAAVLLQATPSQAQCSATSTCRSCHEAHEPPTLDREAPWHEDHGLGLFSGALAFGALSPSFFPALSRLANLGPLTFAGALGVDPWLLVLLLAELAGLLFYALGRRRPRHPRPGALAKGAP